MSDRQRFRRLFAAAVALGLLAAACRDGERPPQPQTPPRPAKPTLRLVAMTDPNGYLAPCGCQSRPLGGIDKAAAQLRALRSDGVPTLFVAAGNLFYSADTHEPQLDGAADEAAQQARWQAEALAQIFARLELVAAVPGPADVERGLPALQQLVSLSGARVLGLPGAAAEQTSGDTDTLLLERSGVRIGVWGVSQLPGSATASDPVARAQALSDGLRKRGAQIVIGLLQADARSARRVAGATNAPDVLLLGGTESADVPPPDRIGNATLVRAARDGHGLLVVDLVRTGDGAFTDVSAWTRKAEKDAMQASVADLGARVDAWRKDKSVDRALLAEQEARLADMREQLAALDGPARAEGNTLSARFIELDPESPSEPETRALMDAHDKRVNEHNREALAGLMPKPVPAGHPGFAGATRCGDCHESQLAWWKGHAHGHAYATLEQRNKQFNLSCVGCHVTGYNQPGGASVVHNQGLTDVGCESCHGPGSLHIADADSDADKNVHRDVPESVCKQCHTPEHSDHFAYDEYKAKLIVPGHGKPLAAPAPSGAGQ
jgi:hypothetical protein